MFCSFYLLSSNGLPALAAAEAGQYCQEEQQEQRDADTQDQPQNKVQRYSTRVIFVCTD